MTVKVQGLKEFRRDLKQIDDLAPKALGKAHKSIGKRVAGHAQSNARSAGGVWAKGARGIKGYGTQTSASVGVTSGGIPAVAFWGAKKRTGWFANPLKYGAYPSQHPPWVGNTWEAASRTEGPYVINYTLLEEIPHVMEDFGDAVDEMFQAFNE